jgi:hypothetical protein
VLLRELAGSGRDGRGELPALSRELAQLRAVHPLLRLAELRAELDDLLDLGGLTPHEEIDDPRRRRRLAQRLDLTGEAVVVGGPQLLDPRVAGADELPGLESVELVGDLQQRGHAPSVGRHGVHATVESFRSP